MNISSVEQNQTVYLYCISLDRPSDQLSLLYHTLSSDEQQRAARFHFEKDRRYYIAGRGFLRRSLAEQLQVEASQIQFCYNAYGKPALAPPFDQTHLNFNLAHSGDWALYAIAETRRVGVDIERIRPEIEHEKLAKHVFSLDEQRTLYGLPPDQRLAAFFNGWVRKEAYIKAQGLGLSLPLAQFTVSITPGEPARLLHTDHDPEQVKLWSLQALSPAPGYAAALVVEGHDWQLCWRDVQVITRTHKKVYMNNSNTHNQRIAKMIFASVYPMYVEKVEKKGRTKAELHQVIEWLTGFDDQKLQELMEEKATFTTFFQQASLNPNAHLITGVICGYRVEEIENPLTQKARYLDKLVDELAKGRKMEKILRGS